VLLPDGRVLNAGGVGGPGNIMSMEIYSPPYLFRGPRPRITSSPASVTYDEHVSIESPDACRVRKVAMIRASTITHHTNTDQRYLPLKWHQEGPCGLHFRGPANANIAPPGYYMLVLLDDCGVPSVGRLIRLG
jgi:galactose oxidase